MNYLFTICGRAGSKGLANKNLKNFLDVPLVYLTLAAIKMTLDKLDNKDSVFKVVINTDSKELIDLATSQRMIEVFPIVRNEELSGDRVAKVSVINNCLEVAESAFGLKFDLIIDLDITSPLRTVNDVLLAIEKKQSRSDTDVVYSVTHARRNPYFNMAIKNKENGFFEKAIKSNYISRQETPEIFDMNASIYVYNPTSVRNKDHSTFFNTGSDAIVMKDTGVIDIDCNEDLELMQVIAKYYFYTNYKEYKEIYDCAKIMFLS